MNEWKVKIHTNKLIFGSVRSSGCHSVCPSVCPHKFVLSLSTESSSFFHRFVSGQSQVSVKELRESICLYVPGQCAHSVCRLDNDKWAPEDVHIWQIFRCLTLTNAPVTKFSGRMFVNSLLGLYKGHFSIFLNISLHLRLKIPLRERHPLLFLLRKHRGGLGEE